MMTTDTFAFSPSASSPAAPPVCWVVTDGHAGMEIQCIALAEAMGLVPVVKRIRLRAPWRQLTPFLRMGCRYATGPGGDPLTPPWPDLLIGCGRQSTAASFAVKRASGGRTFTVHIQDPQVSPRRFDLVVVPRHDKLRGENVLVTRASLHRITPARLAEARAAAPERLTALPVPRVAVLIGGSNAVYRLTPIVMGEVAETLARLARETGAGLMVTPSRRTGTDNEAILRARLGAVGAEVWDGTGPNPYFAYLALADVIVVTCDSVNMVSEACATGKPVYVIELEGGSPKFRSFLDGLYKDGLARPFTGSLAAWEHPPFDDTAETAAEVARRFAAWRTPRG
jgi:uncharacterized protein